MRAIPCLSLVFAAACGSSTPASVDALPATDAQTSVDAQSTVDAQGCSAAPQCAAPAHGSATCSNSTCGFVCDATYVARGNECVLDVKHIAATDFHSCAIHTDGSLACWGIEPMLANPPTGTFRQVSIDDRYGCALRTDGTIACWGATITPAAPTGTFQEVAVARGGYGCGLRTDGTLACWGFNPDGRANPPTGQFKRLVGGAFTMCAIAADAHVDCWGAKDGVSGVDPSQDSPAGQALLELSMVREQVTAITTTGQLLGWQWGPVATALTLPSGANFVQTCTGKRFACALRADHSAVCTSMNTNVPLNGAVTGSFTQLACGADHFCGIRTDHKVECFGRTLSTIPAGDYL